MLDRMEFVLEMVGWLDLAVFLFATLMWIKKERHRDTVEQVNEPGRWLTIMVISAIVWPILLVIGLVIDVLQHDWIGALIDVVCLLWLFWMFFGDNFKKRFKKRMKEVVAVVKGRLKVISVPSPLPA